MSSESEDEDYVCFGTPLDPIEENAVPSKKFQKVEDQIATDQYGRRRFHGAFTGGYSAGFFNTVGSLEGWTPSSFKSSKNTKTEVKSQRPEDFMDEEDTSEFGIAPKAIRVKSTFSDSNTSKRKLPQYHSGSIPGEPVLSEILEPVRETIGVQLLKSMGWKPGQGIGPRVTKTEKTRMKERLKKSVGNKKIYGCASFPSSKNQERSTSSEEGSGDELEEIRFAPLEFEQFFVQPKTDLFGIGYSGLDRQPVLSSRHYNLFDQPSGVNLVEKQKKVSIRGHAFGVGAFENDDEDIYAQDDMSQYDFSLPCPTASKTVKAQSKPALQYESEIIDGFVEAKKFILKKKFFPPPNLPPGFQPSGLRSVNVSQNTGDKSVSTSKDRAALLGETSRWSAADERKEASQHQPEVAASEAKPVSIEENSSSFKPFASDPSKQKRYEQYLLFVKLGVKDKLTSIQPSSMTEWEKEHERIEFEGAFRLYKPLSGDIADRFTSARHGDDSLDPLAPVERFIDPVLKQMQEAAKMKMFGALTRQVFSWQPDPLVFKRFNIAETKCERGSLEAALDKKRNRPKFSLFNFADSPTCSSSRSNFNPEQSVERISTNPSSAESESKRMETDVVSSTASKDESSLYESQSALELSIEERLKMFQNIFLDSSDDEENPKNIKTHEKLETNVSVEFNDQSLIVDSTHANNIRNTAPAKGIFANLDLDKLSMPPQSLSNCSADSSSSSQSSENEEEKTSFYGPQLPSKSSVTSGTPAAKISVKSIIENSGAKSKKGEWIEEKSKQRKHKKHKKDHKKHKSKHKKKKHKK